MGGNAIAGLMLKSEFWNGIDAYGFGFLPYPGQSLQGLWRSVQNNCGTGQARVLLQFNAQAYANVACYFDQSYVRVRCVKTEYPALAINDMFSRSNLKAIGEPSALKFIKPGRSYRYNICL